MPNPAMDGNSTAIVFGTSGFDANVISLDGPSSSRESIESSHLGTVDNMTFFAASLADNGEVSLTVEFDPDIVWPFGTGTVQLTEEITITWPLPVGQSTAATMVFDAFATANSGAASNGERMEGTFSLKLTGAITQTPSA
tara:strand:- start:9429 stop:9848 length:420 start_codon:yes stop_codon:yes gene_type:complete